LTSRGETVIDIACVDTVTYTGQDVLCSSDCGFAQGPYLHRTHPSIQWARLSSLAEGAKLASGELV